MIRPTIIKLVLALVIAIAAISALSGCSSQLASDAHHSTTNNFTNGGISDLE